MKAVILAGGLGSRLSEETDIKPKPKIFVLPMAMGLVMLIYPQLWRYIVNPAD